MGLFRRALDAWVATPKWWKGFYITFPIAWFFLTPLLGNPRDALLFAFLYAVMIAFALWLSEWLKVRRRGTPGARRGVDERDLRRRR